MGQITVQDAASLAQLRASLRENGIELRVSVGADNHAVFGRTDVEQLRSIAAHYEHDAQMCRYFADLFEGRLNHREAMADIPRVS